MSARIGFLELVGSRQFILLVLLVGFVGATLGVERTTLIALGKSEFGLQSALVLTSFIAAFGVSKALTNLVAGHLADRIGRRHTLLLGWLLAPLVPWLLIVANHWYWVVAANVLLGINQGLCWTLTLLMKIDLGTSHRRGLAAGINESIGYGMVAIAAAAGADLAARYGLRPYPLYIALTCALLGLVLTALLVDDTQPHAIREQGATRSPINGLSSVFSEVSWRRLDLVILTQAGLVRNLADGVAWGLLMIYLTGAAGAKTSAELQVLMIVVFGLTQFLFGAASDRWGRHGFIASGMVLLGIGFGVLSRAAALPGWTAGVALLGLGGAMMYPTVIAALGDRMEPVWRASGLGVYRFWRDMGYAVGAIASGLIADRIGTRAAILSAAAACLVSAAIVALGPRASIAPRTP
jgi:MFS family permease